MDKNTLKGKLNMLYAAVEKREDINRKYQSLIGEVRSQKKELGRVHTWQRFLVAAIFFVPFMGIGYMGDVVLTMGLSETDQTNVMNVLTVIMGVVILAGILAEVFLVKIIAKTSWYKKRMEALNVQEQKIKNEYGPQYREMVKKGMAAFPELGQKYHTLHALRKMDEYLSYGRASSIKEMIDIYELECHQESMRQNQERMLYELAVQQDEINSLQAELDYVKYYS